MLNLTFQIQWTWLTENLSNNGLTVSLIKSSAWNDPKEKKKSHAFSPRIFWLIYTARNHMISGAKRILWDSKYYFEGYTGLKHIKVQRKLILQRIIKEQN